MWFIYFLVKDIRDRNLCRDTIPARWVFAKNNDVVILIPDKGNRFVILNKKNYVSKMEAFMNDECKFQQIVNDPTETYERGLHNLLRRLRKKSRCTIGV